MSHLLDCRVFWVGFTLYITLCAVVESFGDGFLVVRKVSGYGEKLDIILGENITALKACGLTELADQLMTAFMAYVERIYNCHFNSVVTETFFTSENPSVMSDYLCQGYMLSGDKKYLPRH